MPKLKMYEFNPVKLIEEVRKRPGLYRADQPTDREEKLMLWKEVGSSLYTDWDTFSKATAYDRVLQLQRKWRSLRDAYNRELRARRSGVRVNRRVYMYFKRMSFLGGYEGTISEDEDMDHSQPLDNDHSHHDEDDDPLTNETVDVKPKRKKRAKKKHETAPEEIEMPVYTLTDVPEDNSDSDRLFLLSFLPEMRQLPVNVKMWARAQIANVMQEAVACQYSNATPSSSNPEKSFGNQPSSSGMANDVKRQRQDSLEC